MIDSNAYYSSEWDIDQIIPTTEIDNLTIPLAAVLGSTLLYTHNLPYVPTVDGQWQLAGETVWRQFGDITGSAGANFTQFLNVDATGVYIQYYNFVSTRTVNVRFQVWADKVTH